MSLALDLCFAVLEPLWFVRSPKTALAATATAAVLIVALAGTAKVMGF